MAKIFFKRLSKKGSAIKYQTDRGLINAQISKTLGIPNQQSDIIGKFQLKFLFFSNNQKEKNLLNII